MSGPSEALTPLPPVGGRGRRCAARGGPIGRVVRVDLGGACGGACPLGWFSSLAREAHPAAWSPVLRGFGLFLLDALEGLEVELGAGDAGLCPLALLVLANPCGGGHVSASRYGERMNDVALVALITTSGTVLVALLGYVAGFFNDRWQDRRRAAREAAAASDKERFDSLRHYSAALMAATNIQFWQQRLDVQEARITFVSTLRRGEGLVANFADALTNEVASNKAGKSLKIAVDGSDQLFAWLRGDLEASELRLLSPGAAEDADAG